MKKNITTLVSALFCGFIVSQSSAAEAPVDVETVLGGFTNRVDSMFEAERGNALVRPKIKTLFREYSYDLIAHVTRLLYLGETTAGNEVATVLGMYSDFYAANPEYTPADDINAILQDNALIYIEQHEAYTSGEPYDHPQTKNGYEDLGKSMILDRDSFHWHAPEIMRLIEMYGPGGTEVPEGEESPITQATVDLCLQPIFTYAQDFSKDKHREYESSKTWDIYESENHHAMSVATSWYFAKLAKDHPDYQNLTYAGTLKPAGHYEKWNQYAITYFRERAKKGMLIERMSGKYNSSLMKGVYNMYDFGNDDVKAAAGKFLDLFFAYFSQEQFDGIQGGGKGRIYFVQGMISERVSHIKNTVWYYFGIGDYPPAVDGHDISAALSSYRPPAIVADLVLDPAGRGTYEVKQFPRGQASSFGSSSPNKIKSNVSGIQRYTYCDPSFILGSSMTKARPNEDWAPISSQNRWQGVIFPADTASGMGPTRIVPMPKPSDERRALNAGWSVQSKGCLITQKFGPDYNKGDTAEMLVWLNREGLTLSKENGNLFVDSGIPTDQYGNLVDGDGNIIHKDGYRLISDDGYLMDANGIVEPKVRVWSTHSQVIKNGQTQKDVSYGNQSGILFVETPAAYVAIRTVGNYTVSEVDKFYKMLWDYPPKGWVVTPDDEYAPVILEVMSKAEVMLRTGADTFEDFKMLVLNVDDPTFNGTVMSYTSIYGDTITLDTAVRDTAAEFIQTPTINGQAVAYEPNDKVLESPYLNAKYNTGVVTVSNPDYTDLVLDFNEPVSLASLTPENTATKVSLMPSLVATFDGDIVVDSGAILLKKLSDNSIVETFDVTDAAEVTITDSQLSFTPSSYLEMNTDYYIEIPEGVVGNFFEDFSGNSHWSFTTIDTYPAITTLVPGNGVSNAPVNTPLMATFDVPVQAGIGSIALKKQSDDSIVEQFDVTDSDAVTFSGNSVILSPSVELVPDTVYYVEIPANAVRGQNGVFHQGVSGDSHWSFSVTDTKFIFLVNSASKVVASSLDNSSTSFGFDASADASADMIIVAVSTERGNGDVAVRYAGHTLSNAVDFVQAGIWYLDLTQTDYAGGSATLEIDFSDVGTVNGVGVGVVSVSASGAGIDLHATGTGESSVNLTTTQEGAFNVVSFNANSSGTPSVNAPLTKVYASGNIGSAVGAAGYQANVSAGTHSYSWKANTKRAVAAASFVVRDSSFSGWVERNNLGANSNLDDDPDGDGWPNGIEAFFGSHPGEALPGLMALNVSGPISLTHPQSEQPPSDLQLSYSWSIDLIDWYASDGIDGPPDGETVSISSELADGTNTVTVTPSAEMDHLFLRAEVRQQ